MAAFRSLVVILVTALSAAADPGNLLRNGDFQDDWLTLLPELKNHHWNYTTEVFNRRDYNPDGWRLSGKWRWEAADRPAGHRRLVLTPTSKAVQAVNWVTVNNPRALEGWPDAGGYPKAEFVRSKQPLALVRNLTLRVRLSGTGVPAKAGAVTLAWAVGSPVDDLAGSRRVASVSTPLPEGTFAGRSVTVTLSAQAWLAETRKDPQFATGALLPGSVVCEVAYAGAAGQVEVHEAVLEEGGPASPNLLPTGGFEGLAGKGYPAGWSRPIKYRYFPPGLYYLFNTWHNSNSANRGLVRADELVPVRGQRCLQMVVAAGDEVCVVSDPVTLNQKEPRLIEVSALVKTEELCMLQIDAEDEQGRRLDGFNFIHKNPLSVGTNDWRRLRQVFRPAARVRQIRLKLCARGMNGYTLDDTGHIPQQNVAGAVWWDEVRLHEPESSADDLRARGVGTAPAEASAPQPHLRRLDLGERMIGRNELGAEIVSPGRDGRYRLAWSFETPSGKEVRFHSDVVAVKKDQAVRVRVPYTLAETCPPYAEYRGTVQLLDGDGKSVSKSPVWFGTWTVPMDLELGALYLRPDQKQFVRVNLGLAWPEMERLKALRLDVVRRGTGEVVKSFTVPAAPADVQARRQRLPDGLREDLGNLVLADLDVGFLPVQPFSDPERRWVVRATAVDRDGKDGVSTTSAPFCRLGHDGPQPAVRSVRIDNSGLVYVNDAPWMPWGVTYGHNPVYDGPADAAKSLDLCNLQPWSLYDRHGGQLAVRRLFDHNCLRFVEGGGQIKPDRLEAVWKESLYASTLFVKPPGPGQSWPDDYLKHLKAAPMVVSVSPGPEETFGHFSGMSAAQVEKLRGEADYLRKSTGKPVMVGHGGYWTRLEFERVPFYDIYDPETEPFYPAPLHTDLRPLVAGKAQAVWLRPQMYEDVPFERWRYHVFVELIRGARGWQVAHGPGDASTFRGLHAEVRRLQPAVYSKEPAPTVSTEPPLEHMARKVGGKTVVVAASTHGLSFGTWAYDLDEKSPAGRARVSADPYTFRDESDGYHAAGTPPAPGPCPHGVQNLIDPRAWPAGSKLVTWMKLDGAATPRNLVALVKADGRWVHAAAWGKVDLAGLRADNAKSFWFLRTFYRHARGFLGWGDKVPPHALAYIPEKATPMGEPPAAGKWVKLEVPLDRIGAAGKLLDGVAFLHEGGRAWWARTCLVGPDGKETVVFGDHEDRPAPDLLEKTRINVKGLKKGTNVRVLFEDREITAEDGYFVDDFRGVDLYQRFGGKGTGYGDAPVALHVYEIPGA